MPGLAKFRLEAYRFHEGLIILLSDWISLEVPVADDTLHIVRQDMLRDSHIVERTDHANEQIFLLVIGKEFHIPLPAVVADLGKAGGGVFHSVIIQNFGKSPVHLVGFPRCFYEPKAAFALRCYPLSLGRHEILVRLDVPFDGTELD